MRMTKSLSFHLLEEVEMFRVSSIDIDPSAELAHLRNPRAGALVTFEGWVRNHHEGRDVLHLEYQAYEALCVNEAESLKAEVLKAHDVLDLACVHRVGHSPIGTMAVWVGATAEHRGSAFDACEHYIDALKVRFPIWKRETYVDGEAEWVRCEACASHADTHGHDHSHSHSHVIPEGKKTASIQS